MPFSATTAILLRWLTTNTRYPVDAIHGPRSAKTEKNGSE
jgi:hypothetical protein